MKLQVEFIHSTNSKYQWYCENRVHNIPIAPRSHPIRRITLFYKLKVIYSNLLKIATLQFVVKNITKASSVIVGKPIGCDLRSFPLHTYSWGASLSRGETSHRTLLWRVVTTPHPGREISRSENCATCFDVWYERNDSIRIIIYRLAMTIIQIYSRMSTTSPGLVINPQCESIIITQIFKLINRSTRINWERKSNRRSHPLW